LPTKEFNRMYPDHTFVLEKNTIIWGKKRQLNVV
jgi:hypothetical protein